MIITGKIVAAIEIKCTGDVFHNLFAVRPHDISNISPDIIHTCDLHEGEYGKVGSIICWEFTHEGVKKSARQLIEVIDEENQIVKLSVLDSEILDHYKTFTATIHVETQGDKQLVTWTLEYEKLNQDIPDPVSFIELAFKLTQEIEAHHHGDK